MAAAARGAMALRGRGRLMEGAALATTAKVLTLWMAVALGEPGGWGRQTPHQAAAEGR
jgi:hypothetical protein